MARASPRFIFTFDQPGTCLCGGLGAGSQAGALCNTLKKDERLSAALSGPSTSATSATSTNPERIKSEMFLLSLRQP